MQKVTFVLRNGKERLMKERLASHLERAGKGHIKTGVYLTRDMQAAPIQQAALTPSQPQATAAAQALADQKSMDITSIEGTGRDGAVTVGDVKKAVKQSKDAD